MIPLVENIFNLCQYADPEFIIKSMLPLEKDHRIIVHRGLSNPICPVAELSNSNALQQHNGHHTTRVGLLLAIVDIHDRISLKCLGDTLLKVKRIGEPNGILDDAEFTPFLGWWCHVTSIKSTNFALIGRPNKRWVAPQKQIPSFDHLISTKRWKMALNILAESEAVKAYIEDKRTEKSPYTARAFDGIGVPFAPHSRYGYEWTSHC
ncbi:hypothetical protein IPG41_01230 [Candidatus Peregrinibacteria bacterium]|nr:MAG: hypothetical protein IPG41_01230 [Candidatus Peregrinibacteria bacterium]